MTSQAETRELKQAAQLLRLLLDFLNASTDRDIKPTFAALLKQRANALLLTGDALLFGRRDQLVALSRRHAVPAAIYPWHEFPDAGSLMSYGASQADAFSRMPSIALRDPMATAPGTKSRSQ